MFRDWRVRTAARVARTFRLDPMLVLDATHREWLIRIAAHNVVVEDEKKAAQPEGGGVDGG